MVAKRAAGRLTEASGRDTDARPGRLRRRRVVAVALVAILLAAASAHLYAESLGRHARDTSLPTAERVEAARLARTLEPWDESHDVTLRITEAEVLLERDEVDAAYSLLAPLAPIVRDDELFRSVYHRVLESKTILDSRKAHIQHAREQEDGSLDPEDVLR